MRNFLIATIVPTIALFLLSALIFSLILGGIGLPGPTGFLAALVFMAAMIVAKRRQLEKERKGTSLTISPEGFVVDDPAGVLQMPWSGVRAVGLVKAPKPVDLRKTSLPFLGRGGMTVGGGIGGAIGGAVLTTQTGILGLGAQALKVDAPALKRAEFEQNVGINGVDAETGQSFVAVLAQLYDADWQSGRIGDWVRAYRPDVMPVSS